MRDIKKKDSLAEIVSPYLDIGPVLAAALVSTDGLLVAAAGGGVDLEALAAHSASALAATSALAAELGGPPRLLSLETGNRGLILAPLTKDVFLALAGKRSIMSLAR